MRGLIVLGASVLGIVGCRDVIDLRSPPAAATPAPTVTQPTPTPTPTEGARFEVLLDDPLGDGSHTATVLLHDGLIVVGPSADGARAVRVGPLGDVDGTIAFVIHGDGQNRAGPTFTSFGAPGCQPNTLACGPDNESSSALLRSALLDGVPTLVASGGKSEGGVRDVYLGTVTGDVATFSFVDLNGVVGSDVRGVGVVHDDGGGRVALGLRTKGHQAPALVELLSAPDSSGAAHVSANCSAAQGNVCDRNIPALNAHDVDAVGAVGGFTYVASAAGIARTAGALGDATSFEDVTPTEFAADASAEDDHDAGAPESARAVVGFAPFGDGVLYGRNTDTGPELKACASSSCAPSSWTSVGGVSGTRVSAVLERAGGAVVAVDDVAGIHVYEGDASGALTALDHLDGLGQHVLGSQLVSIGDQSWLYVLVDDDTGPARLARILL